MKIGILTFHCAHNYGAMLQAYALRAYLQSQGHDACVIDYRPDYLVSNFRKHSVKDWLSGNPLNCIRKFFAEPFLYGKREKRWENFEQFSKSHHRLFPYKEFDMGKGFDLVLFGSDQIWNRQLTGGIFDPVFWAKDFGCRCASYAASIGWYKPSDCDRAEIAGLLKNFDAVSVRENDLADFLAHITDMPVSLVCDPVLLLSEEEWDKICVPVPDKKPYVLCYDILNSPECRKAARMICMEKGYEMKEISGFIWYRSPKNAMLEIGPAEFVSYFRNAAYIVTSSFHGTAFSLLFNKSFYSVGLMHTGGRISSLLSIAGLEDRMKVPVSAQDIADIDYSGHNELLRNYIDKSRAYIEEQMKK